MASPNPTPFIPPLGTPSEHSRAILPPDSPMQPLLSPNAPIPPNLLAAWQSGPIPPPLHRRAHSSPWTQGNDLDHMSTEQYLRSQPPPNVSATWVGLNQGWPSPYGGNSPVHPPPNLVSPPPAPPPVLGTPWAGPSNTPFMGGGFPANTPMAPPPQPLWGAPPPGWGAPPPQMGTPFGMPPGPYGMMAPPMAPPQQVPPPQASRPPRPAPIPSMGNLGDRVSPWTEGTSYGPVLETAWINRIGCSVQLNPLIGPPPDDGSDRVHLEWNMLYESTFVKKSSDPPRASWAAGRNEPATFPRVTSIRLIAKPLPWTITIQASRPEVGVTCGDVIEGIARFLSKSSSEGEYKAQSPQRQIELGQYYRRHREIGHDVPGGRLGQGMLRLDWLGPTPRFGGIVPAPESFVIERCGTKSMPCTFELKCLHAMLRTEQERADAEAAAAAASAGYHRSRHSTPSHHSTPSIHIDNVIPPTPSSTASSRRRMTPASARSRRLSNESSSD